MGGPGIKAIGCYLPKAVRLNSYFYDKPEQGGLGLETSEAWIIQRTGIQSRHVAADNEFASDMGVNASKEVLEMARMSAGDLKQIILATATPDYQLPPTSNVVQVKLGAGNIPACDLGNACNGALASLEMAYGLIASGFRENALVIGTERLTRIVDYRDRATCILFGDGAGAALVVPMENPGPFSFVIGSDGTGGEHIYLPGVGAAGVYPASEENMAAGRFHVKLDGQSVYKAAVKRMTETAHAALEKAGVRKEDVTWLIPHQANERIIEAVAKHLGLTEKGVSYIKNIGNISSASIFVAMCRMYEEGWLQQDDILLLAAIGSGYNYGSGVIQWNVPNPNPRPAGQFADYKLA